MPRRRTTFSKNNYYHIYNRGANKQKIFFNAENYLYCLRLLKKYSVEYQIAVIAYCLMPNHYHFLVRQDGETAVSHFIGSIFNAYVQAVNRGNGRSGALFESRFKDIHVNNEGYLQHLCCYIHANPVKANLVTSLAEWPFSNYLEWIGKRDGKLVDSDFVNHYFPEREEYVRFVTDYLKGEATLPEGIQRYLF